MEAWPTSELVTFVSKNKDQIDDVDAIFIARYGKKALDLYKQNHFGHTNPVLRLYTYELVQPFFKPEYSELALSFTRGLILRSYPQLVLYSENNDGNYKVLNTVRELYGVDGKWPAIAIEYDYSVVTGLIYALLNTGFRVNSLAGVETKEIIQVDPFTGVKTREKIQKSIYF